MLTDQSRITKLQNQLSSKIGEEVVLLSIDEGKYFKINDIGSAIWDLLESPHTLRDLVDQLMTQFEVDIEECKTETSEFVLQLAEFNLVSVE